MNLNLARAISVLSRMGVPLDINSSRVKVLGTSITINKRGSSITIKSDKLSELDFQFGIDTFNAEVLIQRTTQAMTQEAGVKAQVILEGIYNSIVASELNLNNIYIEKPENNTTAIILPTEKTISITVFQGLVSNGAVKATMVLPLTNDPLKYIDIINSLM